MNLILCICILSVKAHIMAIPLKKQLMYKKKIFQRIKPNWKLKRICGGVDFRGEDDPKDMSKIQDIFIKEHEVKFKIQVLKSPYFTLDEKLRMTNEQHAGKLTNGGLYKDWNFTM